MRHFWWHDHIRDDFLAVATDEAGEIVSAWVQVDRVENRWVPVERFAVLRRVLARGEIHKNADGFTDELPPSRGPTQ
jgi:hypothetical protein